MKVARVTPWWRQCLTCVSRLQEVLCRDMQMQRRDVRLQRTAKFWHVVMFRKGGHHEEGDTLFLIV